MPYARVSIGVPSYDKHEPLFSSSLRSLVDHSRAQGLSVDVIERNHLPVDQARNEIAEEVVRLCSTHLLFVDDDMVFQPSALTDLLRWDHAIVGGLCFSRVHPYNPILLRKKINSDDHGYVYDYPSNRLIDVDATGCGFLLIQTGVFRMIGCIREFEGQGWFDKIKPWSEDYSFCFRAKGSGYTINVSTGTKIGHVAKVVVDEEFAARNRRARVNAWEE